MYAGEKRGGKNMKYLNLFLRCEAAISLVNICKCSFLLIKIEVKYIVIKSSEIADIYFDT